MTKTNAQSSFITPRSCPVVVVAAAERDEEREREKEFLRSFSSFFLSPSKKNEYEREK